MKKVVKSIESVFDTPVQVISNSHDKDLRISIYFKGENYSISLHNTYVHLSKERKFTELPHSEVRRDWLRRDLFKAFNYFLLPTSIENELLKAVDEFTKNRFQSLTFDKEQIGCLMPVLE